MIDYLREFVVVAETLNFRAAAKKLFLSQPSLSRHIARLEEELGAPLFLRTTKEVRLTPFGQSILPDAERVVADYAALMEKAPAHSLSGPLRIAGFVRQPDVAKVLDRTVSFFETEYPNVALSVSDTSVSAPDALLLDGSFDVVLGPRIGASGDDRISWLDLFEIPINVWVSEEGQLGGEESVTLEQLAPFDFVFCSSGDFKQIEDYYVGLFERRGIAPRIGRRFVNDAAASLRDNEFMLTAGFPPELFYGLTGIKKLRLAGEEPLSFAAFYLAVEEHRAAGAFARQAAEAAPRRRARRCGK